MRSQKTKSEHYVLIDSDIAFILSLFLLTQEAQKKKLRKKKNAVFLCRFLKKAPQKLSLIALCEMYKVPDGIGRAMCVR